MLSVSTVNQGKEIKCKSIKKEEKTVNIYNLQLP